MDLPFAQSTSIRVPGIVYEHVIPDQVTNWLEHAQYLVGYSHPGRAVDNGTEYGELQYQVEAGIGKVQ